MSESVPATEAAVRLRLTVDAVCVVGPPAASPRRGTTVLRVSCRDPVVWSNKVVDSRAPSRVCRLCGEKRQRPQKVGRSRPVFVTVVVVLSYSHVHVQCESWPVSCPGE